MINKELFDKKNIELFMPDGVEFIYNILENTGFINFTTSTARKKGMETIAKLFELQLIEVFHWGKYQDNLKEKKLSNSQIIKFIDELWLIGTDVPDFYSLPMFKYKDWYLKCLKEQGLTETTDWKWFVKNKIGDLEKWIEENRPKKD